MRNFFKTTFLQMAAYSLVLATVLFSACKDDDEPSNEVKFNNITINGEQEAPNPINTTATGNINATYNKTTKIITYTITFNGLTPINMHFHKGAPGVAGGIEIPIPGPYTSPLRGTTTALTAEQETELLAGNWYVNIHSDAYKGGEIRGQMIAK